MVIFFDDRELCAEEKMMNYIGLDVHKRVVEACIIDSDGKVIERMRFATKLEEFTVKKGAPSVSPTV